MWNFLCAFLVLTNIELNMESDWGNALRCSKLPVVYVLPQIDVFLTNSPHIILCYAWLYGARLRPGLVTWIRIFLHFFKYRCTYVVLRIDLTQHKISWSLYSAILIFSCPFMLFKNCIVSLPHYYCFILHIILEGRKKRFYFTRSKSKQCLFGFICGILLIIH